MKNKIIIIGKRGLLGRNLNLYLKKKKFYNKSKLQNIYQKKIEFY